VRYAGGRRVYRHHPPDRLTRDGGIRNLSTVGAFVWEDLFSQVPITLAAEVYKAIREGNSDRVQAPTLVGNRLGLLTRSKARLEQPEPQSCDFRLAFPFTSRLG